VIDHNTQVNVGKESSFPILLAILSSLIVTLACSVLPQPPTPRPFPFEGVRQMTFDYAFYQDLLWSPNGEYIAATRCPIEQYEANCLGNEEAVLIDPLTGAIDSIDFSSLTSNPISSSAIAWSSKGDKLLLYFRESPNTDPAPLSERRKAYVSYEPKAGSFDEIDLIWPVAAWSEDAFELLIAQGVDENTIALGWYPIETQEFREEIRYPFNVSFRGPYSLSPDQRVLLQSDSSSPMSCNEIQSYTIGSHDPYTNFLSLACFPTWSPNGTKLAFTAKNDNKGLPNRLMIANSDGSNATSLFDDTTPHDLAYPTWSPDGRQIAFTMGGIENASAIYIVDVPEYLQPKSD
jgi:hypothetical protein